VVRRGWVLNAMTWPVYPKEKPGTHRVGSWTGTRAILNGCRQSHQLTFNPSTTQPIVRHIYTNTFHTLHHNCQNTMSKLSKELRNRLSTKRKIFTLPYDVLNGISKYSQIYQTSQSSYPQQQQTAQLPYPQPHILSTHFHNVLRKTDNISHLQPHCPLFS